MPLAFAAALAVTAFVPALQPGDTVPAIPLIDQSGRAFSIQSLRGDVVIVSFIYTRCADPAMCPLTSAKFARLQTLIGTQRIRLLEITLDPRFDSPRVLNAYGQAFHQDPARWIIATGAETSIADLAARFGIATQWTRPGTLVHTESAIVLDRAGRVAQTIDGNAWTPGALLAAATEAGGASRAPLARIGLWLTSVAQACGGGRGTINVIEGLALLALLAGALVTLALRSLRSTH
jgi:cytochrome oxidase Cu insertion factor (SCO1/SenC/PrrC family)